MTETTYAVLAIMFGAIPLLSQAPRNVEFNHTAIYVQDLSKSTDFYEQVMGLEKIPDPFHDGRHVWLRVGPHSQLHLVAGATRASGTEISLHTAFRVPSITDFKAHLDQMKIKYRTYDGTDKTSVRPDGVHQIYLQDPDGYWIEVNDDRF